ncbi:hypothetical protein Tco_1317212 [Tanacetum coccineum]
MAQRQQAADVHPDDLCPPNKRYDLMDANKKVDLENNDGIKHRPQVPADKKSLLLLWMTSEQSSYSTIPQANDNNMLRAHRSCPTPSVIRFQLPSRQSARLTPPVPVPTTEKADEMILQDTLQISLAKQKSHEEQDAEKMWHLYTNTLAAEEIEKLVEESKNVDDSSPSRHDDTSIPGTRIEPRSDKERLEVEIVQEKEEETTKDTEVEPNIVIPVNVDDEDDEITDEVFELRRRAKGKNVEESRISPIPSPTRSPRNLSTLESLDTEKLQAN